MDFLELEFFGQITVSAALALYHFFSHVNLHMRESGRELDQLTLPVTGLTLRIKSCRPHNLVLRFILKKTKTVLMRHKCHFDVVFGVYLTLSWLFIVFSLF